MPESNHAIENAKGWLETVAELIARLEAADNSEREEVEQEIQESPLSVLVRDGWRSPGAERDSEPPEEFEILLSTGGPALRIYGRLDQYGQADDFPKLQWQDWGTPWTDYEIGEEREALQKFANQFYFGDG